MTTISLHGNMPEDALGAYEPLQYITANDIPDGVRGAMTLMTG
jgi:hypothetical protein